MDIEELVKKHAGEWGEYTQIAVESSIRAALTELAAGYEQDRAATEFELNVAKERITQLEVERVPSPSCRECANRGRVNGLSQEAYCDSCVWQGQSFRVNHYVAAPQPKKEGE